MFVALLRFYKEGALRLCPTDAITVTARTENSITLTTDRYIHAVELEGEQIYEDNYFSLLPGESRTVSYTRAKDARSDEISVTAYTLE